MEKLLEADDGLESCLEHCDFRTLTRNCKAVSKDWARACRRTLTSENFFKRLPLLKLIEHRAPARAFAARMAVTGHDEPLVLDDDENLPLHLALEARMPEAAILTMLDSSIQVMPKSLDDPSKMLPRATTLQLHPLPHLIAKQSNRWRLLPIHLAVSHGASEGVISRLLELHPSGVKQRGRGSRLPLHLAVTHGAPTGAVLAMLAAYPDAAQCKTADAKEGLPLHLATAHGASIEIIHALLKAFPTACIRECGSVGLPIHAACKISTWPPPHSDTSVQRPPPPQRPINEWVPVVKAILDAFPEGAQRERRIDGKLPIHIAAEARASAVADAYLASYNHGTAQVVKACSGLIDTLLEVYPVTSEWSVEALLRCRDVGESALLTKLLHYEPTSAQRQEDVLLARSCGAPSLVMRALAVGPTAVRQRSLFDESWEPPSIESPVLPSQPQPHVSGMRRANLSPGDWAWGNDGSNAGAIEISKLRAEAAEAAREAAAAVKAQAEAAKAAGSSSTLPADVSELDDAENALAALRHERAESTRIENELASGQASMGSGGSYVLPPSRLADQLIRLHSEANDGDARVVRLVVVWTPGVRVRAQPSTSAPIVRKLRTGAILQGVRDAEHPGWFRVALSSSSKAGSSSSTTNLLESGKGGDGWVIAAAGNRGQQPVLALAPPSDEDKKERSSEGAAGSDLASECDVTDSNVGG